MNPSSTAAAMRMPNKTANQNIDEEVASGEDERGDLLIQGFWTAGTDCILDVCVTDKDAESHCKRTCSKCQWSCRKERRIENTSARAWRIAVTSHLLCFQWTDCLDEKLTPLRNILQ
jgi:hypothetical protein